MRTATVTSYELFRQRGKVVFHYLLIYLMIAMADSFLFDRVLTNLTAPLCALLMLIILMNRKYQLVYPLSVLALGLVTMLFVRANTGAMGPTEYLGWAAMILAALVAILFDFEHFLIRFIRLTVFLTSFSLAVYLISQVVPGIWRYFTPFSFPLTIGTETYFDTFDKVVDYYQASGLFIYVDRGFEADRNVGIFREPAVYQILLNSMVFVLLFMRPSEINYKTRNWLIVLFVVGILSTKSATGYATTLLIFLMYAVELRHKDEKISIFIPIGLGIACITVFVLSIVGDISLVSDSVLGRFLSNGSLSFDGSGQARVGAAEVALSLIRQYPLGCGYDIYGAKLLSGDGLVGACLFKVAAVYGLLMGLAILTWVLYPVLRSHDFGFAAKVSFVSMYFIATYFENEVFYTTLIFIPIYLYCKNINDKPAHGSRGV